MVQGGQPLLGSTTWVSEDDFIVDFGGDDERAVPVARGVLVYAHRGGCGRQFAGPLDGAWQSFSTRFTVAELLDDSAVPPPPAAEPEPAEPEPAAAVPPPPPPPPPSPASPPVERYADGVPVRPSWLGRTDVQ
ncbi:hypothetical protein ABT115_18275 [Streptomyces sp. NPDC001832]|uniref:hypothetical protein n=1 Tax=Streptomyces sp. NPDC001832 TaxID=3154527 RepID=UPI00331F2088